MRKGIITGLSLIIGSIGGFIVGKGIYGRANNEKIKKIEKFKNYYNLLNQWLINKNEGKSLETYFLNNNYNTIAIYGMGELGNRLYEEIKNTNIKVKYAIDKNADSVYSNLDVVNMEEDFEMVDVVVITATFDYDVIKDEISTKIDCPIISLEDVVYEV